VNKRLDVQRRELAMLQDAPPPNSGIAPTESVDEIMAPVTGKSGKKPLPRSGD
jgi:hypothetical protein